MLEDRDIMLRIDQLDRGQESPASVPDITFDVFRIASLPGNHDFRVNRDAPQRFRDSRRISRYVSGRQYIAVVVYQYSGSDNAVVTLLKACLQLSGDPLMIACLDQVNLDLHHGLFRVVGDSRQLLLGEHETS